MDQSQKQTLLKVAKLKLPSFQVVVVNANLGCTHCRHRISQVISKITGLREYTIDVGRKQVIVRGDVRNHHQEKHGGVKSHMINENHSRIFAFFFSLLSFRWITTKKIVD
ncbi:uncharacterized protein LOC107813324 isoform X1 [Nicotiana tabacum]|uniref:Uncharacterized protein LOC107813324 isoform X1 n=2 Tax=Nicotiana TaxID=4085 RepID=A0A1S4BZ01_TOBAC|nr:PREDICTED: uncharacterized protein LOC104211844 isoform X1 [Nicotiana sylvestris]XP_016494063.1 PREDICTED: uncharacterized protein LOC107813324 isoform X1 [Nicotiana tabacum]